MTPKSHELENDSPGMTRMRHHLRNDPKDHHLMTTHKNDRKNHYLKNYPKKHPESIT